MARDVVLETGPDPDPPPEYRGREKNGSPLDAAVRKAYWRLLPLLFLCYVVAYVDRANVGYAKLTMQRDLPAFDNAVIGRGFGIFFLGYFLLEIPGSLLVER
jgi:ACS family tartrate transporter-like MFS transporter